VVTPSGECLRGEGRYGEFCSLKNCVIIAERFRGELLTMKSVFLFFPLQNSSDNLPSYPPDNHHEGSDAVDGRARDLYAVESAGASKRPSIDQSSRPHTTTDRVS